MRNASGTIKTRHGGEIRMTDTDDGLRLLIWGPGGGPSIPVLLEADEVATLVDYLLKSPPGRCGYEQFEPDNADAPITHEQALDGINRIRNSIIGAQNINWSEHIYPLVSLLDRAGFVGMPYPEAKEYIGSLIDRAAAAEAEIEELKARLSHLEDLCVCVERCGDRDPDGEGTCKGLPR